MRCYYITEKAAGACSSFRGDGTFFCCDTQAGNPNCGMVSQWQPCVLVYTPCCTDLSKCGCDIMQQKVTFTTTSGVDLCVATEQTNPCN